MVDVIRAALPKLFRKKGYFDLLGLDFMITAAPENKLVLIEVNTNPALSRGKQFSMRPVYHLASSSLLATIAALRQITKL
jgi:D-alanine-D-alanine ligase-like ATP-grasp enzyme